LELPLYLFTNVDKYVAKNVLKKAIPAVSIKVPRFSLRSTQIIINVSVKKIIKNAIKHGSRILGNLNFILKTSLNIIYPNLQLFH
jgi:hypothetical protein